MNIPEAEYDDLFYYAPSYVLAEQLEAAGIIVEGKALGTARDIDKLLIKNVSTSPESIFDPAAYAKKRKIGQTVGKRALKRTRREAMIAITTAIAQYEAGSKTKKAQSLFKKTMTMSLKTAWKQSFLAGVRAGGTKGEGAGKGKKLVQLLNPHDEKWLLTAMKHEMRFANGFMKAVIENTGKMPYLQRAEMYVNAMESFYNSGRVISLAHNTILHWTGPHDRKTCPSCEYLFAHSPYTKWNLPTTPRSGIQICLTNCRDKILAKRVEPEEALAVLESAQFKRSTMIKHLRTIKRTGVLK